MRGLRTISTLASVVFLANCSAIPPLPPGSPAPTVSATRPPASTTPVPASTATRVAAPATAVPLPTASAQVDGVLTRLPAPLYFLASLSGSQQIWHIEAASGVMAQITDLPAPVELFAVSTATGQLAYLSHNRLWLADELGNNPQSIDTAAAEKSANLADTISSLAWSPDGSRLALAGQNGVWLYRPGEGRLTQLYALPPEVFALWLNAPDAWSADGKMLLLKLAYADSDAGRVVALSSADGELTVADNLSFCADLTWSRDSQFVYASLGSVAVLCPLPGLVRWSWHDNAADVLIASQATGYAGRVHYAQAVHEGPDGILHYFYGTEVIASDEFRQGLVAMVRSARDGVTGRTQLRSDAYALTEALWSPDASLAVIVSAGSSGSSTAGGVWLLSADDAPAVPLASEGHSLQWGKGN